MKKNFIPTFCIIVTLVALAFAGYSKMEFDKDVKALNTEITSLKEANEHLTSAAATNRDRLAESNAQTLYCNAFVVDSMELLLQGDVYNLLDKYRSFVPAKEISFVY